MEWQTKTLLEYDEIYKKIKFMDTSGAGRGEVA
jgi:hypothetical protein